MNIEPVEFDFFISLIKCRHDIFAIRWEKPGKSGYMPAYDLDWEEYKSHKANGGNIQNFNNKKYLSLSKDQIQKHLNGSQFIGIYPLLEDNTSWFIAADFDGDNWYKDCKKFINSCRNENLQSYLERSRSGNGGHVWLFFEQAYPAVKSRKIILSLLRKSGISNQKNESFDRLFPNQDVHSGKGFGNLIALPLNGNCIVKGNNCFIDKETLKPIENQWEFILNIKRNSIEVLEHVDKNLSKENDQIETEKDLSPLSISLSNHITITKSKIDISLFNFIIKETQFKNSEYWAKKKQNVSTWNSPIKLNYIKEENDQYIIPRGLIGKILRYCKENNIGYTFKDNRNKPKEIEFRSKIELRPQQLIALEASRKKDFGIIVAPPGTGKTIMSLAIIAEKKLPALVIVHRKQLLEQWIERINTFLQIPKHEIGIIGNGKSDSGKKITVAMIQSLMTKSLDGLSKSFGTIFIDECHYIPAESFRNLIEQLNTKYLYGITATPFRKHTNEEALFLYLGDIIAEIPQQTDEKNILPIIKIRNTSLEVPFNNKTDNYEELSKILIHDSIRNGLIISDIEKEIQAGRKIAVLTERVDHTVTLSLYLKKKYQVIVLKGGDSDNERFEKWNEIRKNEFDVIIATGQLFGEGTDLQSIESLFLVYPFAYEGKLIQYIGRVQRAEIAPIIYDYRDLKIQYLENLFQKRNTYYRKLYKKGQLKSEQLLNIRFENELFYINNSVSAYLLSIMELPEIIEAIKPGIYWQIRVLKFDENTGLLFGEILDYQIANSNDLNDQMIDFGSLSKIRFRTTDTSKLLQIGILKKYKTNLSSNNKIEEIIKLSFNDLTFKYCAIGFRYFIKGLNKEVDFEIENPFIRPEFEVLKPYFIKALKLKTIPIKICVEYSGSEIISKNVNCLEFERINQEIIDSVKFQFTTNVIVKKRNDNENKVPISLSELDENSQSMYKSEEELLQYALKLKHVKHAQQLLYLSKRHDLQVMKVRFVLEPFSFVFLLTSKDQYLVVWETLSTEEATYIWQINKSSPNFFEEIDKIDGDLQLIKQSGRQLYLESIPLNFTKILHDYHDEKKGFIKWRDSLEQLLG